MTENEKRGGDVTLGVGLSEELEFMLLLSEAVKRLLRWRSTLMEAGTGA